MRKLLVVFAVLVLGFCVFAEGSKEVSTSSYPERKVTMIIPYKAGGGTDVLLRLLASEMEKEWGQQIIIENKAGGASQVGMTELVNAKPDGYTIGGVGNLDHVLVIQTGENVAYNFDSFKYLAAINVSTICLYSNDKNTGFKSLDEIISYAKANPKKLTVSISGKNQLLAVKKLESLTGIEVTTVMQGSGNDSLKAILGGHVDLALMEKNFAAQVEGQGVTTIASFGAERLSVIPDVPTCKELGYDVVSSTYRVILAPKDVPQDICDKITATIKKVSSTPEFQKKMLDMNELYKFQDAAQVTESMKGDMDFTEGAKELF